MAQAAQTGFTGSRAWGQEIGRGAIAGVVGGIVFGMLMAMMGMLPMIAGLVGSNNAVVGFLVHLVISAIIGSLYGLAVGNREGAHHLAPGWLFGVVYGIVWWVLGPLLIMPTMMGMGPQLGTAFSQPSLLSLMGHVIYGVVTALAFVYLTRPSAASARA